MKFKDIFLIPNLVTITRFIITIYLFLNLTPDQFSITNLIVIIAIIKSQFLLNEKLFPSDSLSGINKTVYFEDFIN